MRKNGTWFLAILICLGMLSLATSWASAADWIQQDKWTVAGPYQNPGGCDPGAQAGEKTISDILLLDMGLDAIEPTHLQVVPNAANLVGGAPGRWITLRTAGVGGGDLLNFDAIAAGAGLQADNVYSVAVIYANNVTGLPLDITFCSGTDDSIGIVLNDQLVLSKVICRGDPGCGERTAATLEPGINKIAVAAFEGGGGWNARLQLRRTVGDTVIDDTNATDVTFQACPSPPCCEYAFARTITGTNTCGTDSADVSIKGNNGYDGCPGYTPDTVVTVTERLNGPVKVSNISAGGTFVADAPTTSSCDLPNTPVGPFKTLDIGSPAVAGSTTPIDENTVAVKGGGNDIWAGGDQFQFAYVDALGDFSARAHIVKRDYLPGPNPPSRWGKFGVMARQDCTPNSRYVFAHDCSLDSNGTDPDNIRMAARPTHGGADNYETGHGNAGHHPDWVRVDRIGNQFYAYSSPDGTEWVLLGQQHWPDAPDRCLVGLAVTSHAGAAPIEITFDNLSITGGTTPTPPDVARSGTISWSLKVSDLNTTGLSYTAEASDQNTDVANYSLGLSGGDSLGLPLGGRGSIFCGRERGAVGPDFTHSFDVGNDIAGTSSYDGGSGVYTMRGSGFDVWGDNESFHWAYSYKTGDFDIIVETLEASQPIGGAHGRYGLMARGHCGQNAQSTAMGGHVGTNHCGQDGGTCGFRFLSQVFYGDTYVGFDNQTDVRYPGGEPAKWTRMIKYNNVIYGYAADDEGQTWRPVGSMPFYGADPAKPIQVGFYVQQHGSQIESPVVKFKVHKFGPLDTGLPPIPDDGVGERSELLAETFDSFDTTAWQAQHRDAAFNPVVIDGRLRMKDESSDGQSTSCFSTFGIEDIDAAIYEFEFDAYMTYLNTNGAGHPADGMTFVVSGELDPATLGRVGFGGGSMAYHGLNRAFGALGGDTNIGNNSFAVEMDTWSGGGWGETEGVWMDSMKWHVGINSANNVNSLVMAHDLGDDGAGGVIPLPNIFDPNGIHMKVRYNRGKVSVWVGQNTAEGPPEELTKAVETDVVPISFGYPNATATYGWTGANGGAREIAEVDNFAAYVIDCNDIQDIAAISGAPAGTVNAGDTVTLGSDGSSAGVGDSGALSYTWSVVSGPGAIDGASTGPTVKVKAGPGAGALKVKLTVSDSDGCAANTSGNAEVTINVVGVTTANWIRGNTEGTTLDITDAVNNLNYQFLGAGAPPCLEALNFNGDGALDLSDAVGLLNVLFLGAPVGPDFGKCETFTGCPTLCP